MKIAILSTPTIALPPIGFGGTERVIYNLSEGLVKKGHEVSVFSTGDSSVSSRLLYYYKKALGSSEKITYNPYYYMNHIYHFLKLFEHENFDIIHLNDAGRLSLYFMDKFKIPFVTTLHGAYFPIKDDKYFLRAEKIKQLEFFQDCSFISISYIQRKALPNLNYVANIYNSVDLSEFKYSNTGGDSLSWLGRVDPVKGLDLAILVAKRVKRKLIAYGHINDGIRPYFDSEIKPIIDSKDKIIDFRYEINSAVNKSDFLSNSKLFIFPLRWEEPFGITMIEAMVCGTPVVAFSKGSVPEVIKDGVTGFIVNSEESDKRGKWIVKKTGIEGLCEAVEKIYGMSDLEYRQMRQNCRKHVEENFTVEKMVSEYEGMFQKIIQKK